MLTAQLMAHMDDEHLVAALHAEFEPMIATDVEIELLRRFEAVIAPEQKFEDYDVTVEQIEALLDSHEADILAVTAMLAALNAACINSAQDLIEKIERADKFYDIAQEAGDVITRLNDLVNSTH